MMNSELEQPMYEYNNHEILGPLRSFPLHQLKYDRDLRESIVVSLSGGTESFLQGS